MTATLDEIRRVLLDLSGKVGEIHQQWPDLTGLVLEHERRIQEHERRIIRIESSALSRNSPPKGMPRPSSSPPPTSAKEVVVEYGMSLTNTGSFKASPGVLESIAKRFQDLENEKKVLDAYWARRRAMAAWALPFVMA